MILSKTLAEFVIVVKTAHVESTQPSVSLQVDIKILINIYHYAP